MKIRWLGCTICIGLSSLCLAQDAKPSPINTERPSFTNSPDTLDIGQLQLESGLTYSRTAGTKSWDGPEALIRYGVRTNWELQLGLPNYVQVHDDSGTSSGLGDLTLGVVHHWTRDAAKIDFGTTIYASAPTGKRGFTSGAWDGGVLLLAQEDLGHNWNVGTMLQLDQVTQDGTKNSQAFLSACFTYSANDKTQPFIEVAGLSQRYGGQEAFLQGGVLYRTDNTHQWDVHAATRIDGRQSFANVGVGYSVRF